jgi:hypothetical protein
MAHAQGSSTFEDQTFGIWTIGQGCQHVRDDVVTLDSLVINSVRISDSDDLMT